MKKKSEVGESNYEENEKKNGCKKEKEEEKEKVEEIKMEDQW